MEFSVMTVPTNKCKHKKPEQDASYGLRVYFPNKLLHYPLFGCLTFRYAPFCQ